MHSFGKTWLFLALLAVPGQVTWAQSILNPVVERWAGYSNMTRPVNGYAATGGVDYGSRRGIGLTVGLAKFESTYATHGRAYSFCPIKFSYYPLFDRTSSIGLGMASRWSAISFDGFVGYFAGETSRGPEGQLGFGLSPPLHFFVRGSYDQPTKTPLAELGVSLPGIYLFNMDGNHDEPTED